MFDQSVHDKVKRRLFAIADRHTIVSCVLLRACKGGDELSLYLYSYLVVLLDLDELSQSIPLLFVELEFVTLRKRQQRLMPYHLIAIRN